MQPNTPQFAAYLEQHVPQSVWTSFVTEYPEDQDLLRSEMRNVGFTPAVTCYRADARAPIQHPKGDARTFHRQARSENCRTGVHTVSQLLRWGPTVDPFDDVACGN